MRLAAILALAGTGCSWLTVSGPREPVRSNAPPGMTYACAENCAHRRRSPRPDALKYFSDGATRAVCAGLRDATQARMSGEFTDISRAKPCSVHSSPMFPQP